MKIVLFPAVFGMAFSSISQTADRRKENDPDPRQGAVSEKLPQSTNVQPDPVNRQKPDKKDLSELSRLGPPAEAFSGPDNAADTLFSKEEMAQAREKLRRNQGGAVAWIINVDRLERQSAEGTNAYIWEANAWIGSDLDKLWIKTEGEGDFRDALDESEGQLLWSHAIGPWFDFQTGLRYDYRPTRPDSSHLVIGVQGLAPYFFEIDVAGFISDSGDFSARAEVEYDQRITQKLILQPRLELNASAQDMRALEMASGLTELDAGLRLRYEFIPKFAPYIGINYQTDLGRTRTLTQSIGKDPDRTVFSAGLKFWF